MTGSAGNPATCEYDDQRPPVPGHRPANCIERIASDAVPTHVDPGPASQGQDPLARALPSIVTDSVRP